MASKSMTICSIVSIVPIFSSTVGICSYINVLLHARPIEGTYISQLTIILFNPSSSTVDGGEHSSENTCLFQFFLHITDT